MKRFFLFSILVIYSYGAIAQIISERNIEAMLYFYPGGSYPYVMLPNSKPSLGTKNIYTDNSSVLHAESIINLNGMKVKNEDLLSFVYEDGAIVSYQQRHFKGVYNNWTTTNDRIVLFALPNGDTSRNWTEWQDGVEINCSSDYSFIRSDGQNVEQAVRIVKDFGDTREISYWTKKSGRLATILDSQEAGRTVSEIFIRLNIVEEMTKEAYEEFKIEEAYRSFLESLKKHPRGSLKNEFPEVYDELQRMADSIMTADYKKYILSVHNASISIDVDESANVTSTLIYYDMDRRTIDLPALSAYVKSLLDNNRIVQYVETEPLSGRNCKVHLSCLLKYGVVLKEETFNVYYKKGQWLSADRLPIPDEFVDVVTDIANESLRDNPKLKKQEVTISYCRLRDKIVFM